MLLRELIAETKVKKIVGDTKVNINGITHDSRQVEPGNVFVAVPGFKLDGADYIPEAIAKGARAIVTEKIQIMPDAVVGIFVPTARRALAELSNNFYDCPSEQLQIIGITGTNGKTTTSFILESILEAAGYRAGLLGTVEVKIAGLVMPTKLTTPESSDLQRIFRQMVEDGVTHVVMEVSSHALVLERVQGVCFKGVVFTNLSHDHLDFHHNMEEYFNAKKKLFDMLGKESFAAINTDDPYGVRLYENFHGKKVTYGLRDTADVMAENVSLRYRSAELDITTAVGEISLETRVTGRFNIYNILAAAAAALELGIPLPVIKKGISSIEQIPGRFEIINAGQKFQVIVDFAHSPDSLTKLLETLRSMTRGKIILVFGCTGDRDHAKRPIMGAIAAKLADFSIISTDDPHSEDPKKIIEEIETGMKAAGAKEGERYIKLADRAEAIAEAIRRAGDNDTIVLAGRGHEKAQDFAGKRVEIDDREAARKILGTMAGVNR